MIYTRFCFEVFNIVKIIQQAIKSGKKEREGIVNQITDVNATFSDVCTAGLMHIA